MNPNLIIGQNAQTSKYLIIQADYELASYP
jgi:hypothetical protein